MSNINGNLSIKGTTSMNSQEWEYLQHITVISNNKFQYNILIKQKGDRDWLYEKNAFIYKNK